MAEADLVGALDIGGTKIAAGIVSPDGRVLAQAAVPTRPDRSFHEAAAEMAALLRQAVEQTGGRLAGIGIGCTGPVNPLSGEIGALSFLDPWAGENLLQAVQQQTGLPVRLENDADAAAMGEYAWGAGSGAESFLMITVGTGIGGGLVLGGRLYRGVGGAHPEFGHPVIDPSGPACSCGAHGCWESLAAGPRLESWFRATYPQTDGWDARRICAAADAGDPRGLAAVQREAHYLGVGLANLITQLCPEVVSLGGGLMERLDLFESGIRAVIRQQCGLVPYEAVRLERARLGSQTGLLGAAQVWLSQACDKMPHRESKST